MKTQKSQTHPEFLMATPLVHECTCSLYRCIYVAYTCTGIYHKCTYLSVCINKKSAYAVNVIFVLLIKQAGTLTSRAPLGMDRFNNVSSPPWSCDSMPGALYFFS